MNERQLAEAKRIATEVMGWEWEVFNKKRYYTYTPISKITDGNYRVGEDGVFDANLYVGRPRPAEAPERDGYYVLMWHKWNPFEDDWHEVFIRLTDLGREVTLIGMKDFFSCSISGWYALGNGSNLYTERATHKQPGYAICEACLKFIERSKDYASATV